MRKKTIIDSFILTGAALTAASCGQDGKTPAKQPNVVFILADDLGWGDLSCYGQELFQTPNIDALAQSGIRFTQAYSGTTVSAPSRSCLVTGMHSGHTPIRGNKEILPEGQHPLPEGTVTIFKDLKNAGYTTGAFGKWGLGPVGSTGDPQAQGVDRFFGPNCQRLAHSYYPDHVWDNSTYVELTDNCEEIPYGQGTYVPDLIHEKALEFMTESVKEDKPFFMWYPTTIPHAELIVPEDDIIEGLRGKFPEKPYHGVDDGPMFRKGGYCSQEYPHATFAAMVLRLDRYVGEIVQKLKDLGIYDNTIIIFASDNGPHLEGGADPDFFNSNGPWRGYKRDVYEGGIRVPFIVSWNGHVKPGQTSDFMCSFWDLMPTLRELIGQDADTQEMDGVSLLPLLEGRKGQKEHDYLYFEFPSLGGRQAVHQGPWKLVHMNARGDDEVFELYNLEKDPSETTDVSGSNPEVLEALKAIMRDAHTPSPEFPLLREEME